MFSFSKDQMFEPFFEKENKFTSSLSNILKKVKKCRHFLFNIQKDMLNIFKNFNAKEAMMREKALNNQNKKICFLTMYCEKDTFLFFFVQKD